MGPRQRQFWFGEKSTDSLASLRYNLFSKKIVTAKSFFTQKRLPPTESSTKYHCQRVYFQIMVCIGKEGDTNTVYWGWKQVEKQFQPVMTNKTAAPEGLLKMIHCNCTTACRTQRCSCSCRAHGLPCMPACGPCQVGNCENHYNQPLWEEESDN